MFGEALMSLEQTMANERSADSSKAGNAEPAARLPLCCTPLSL